MKLLLLAVFLSGGHCAYRYRIDGLLDQALEEISRNLAAESGDSLLIGDIGVGGFSMPGATLRNVSRLERIGEAWLRPLYEEAVVSATLGIVGMALEGERIEGPQWAVADPRIQVRENRIAIEALARLWGDWDGEKTCATDFSASIVGMSSVVLVTGDEEVALDEWVGGLFGEITEILDPLLVKAFQRHFDLCKHLRANGYKLKKSGASY